MNSFWVNAITLLLASSNIASSMDTSGSIKKVFLSMGRLYVKKGLNSIWGERDFAGDIRGEKYFEKFVSVTLTESGGFGSRQDFYKVQSHADV
ncbi:MAG: hypothetical protein HFI78_12120 [Lachnospiraceae bacterium]|nr:hypothetical protein [Lachnospiraceae bacterium]